MIDLAHFFTHAAQQTPVAEAAKHSSHVQPGRSRPR